MAGLDVLGSVQFVTVKGKRLAVLDAENWEALLAWLETLEDLQIARTVFALLKSAEENCQRPLYDNGDLEKLLEDLE